jgi:HAE1 family hydrophobic/amphiphilic exporter-1
MLMFILALAILGWRGFTLMKVDRFPAVDFPFVSVVTVFPGASPDDVEDLIVTPIEDAVAGLSGIDTIQSISQEGLGIVVVAFLETVDGNQAAIDVERQVATVRGGLPAEATDPSVVKADFNAIPIMNIILSGQQSQDELAKLAEDVVKPRLQSADGVASVSVFGGREEIVAVKVDPAKLSAYSLPVSSINQAFAANNLTFPVGSLDSGRQKTSVRSVGSFQSLAEVENMVVSGGTAGGPPGAAGDDQPGGQVFLRDVASVEPSFKDTSVLQRYNGQDTVAMSIVKTTDSNAIDVADEIKERLTELNANLPGGAELTIVSDDSEFTRNSVNAVQEDLVLAILITGLVMLVFLHTIRSTFIVLLAIPTSLLATFLVMWALGFSLNVLTLLALTLIIGILVDDSIVVLENIERHLRMDKKPPLAAIDGRSEIGLAAIAITLTDVVVYVPVAFTSGIIGQFFRSYGITIAVATMFSLFISFTLTPLLSAYLLKEHGTEEAPRKGVVGFFARLLKPIDWAWKKFIGLWEAGFVGLSNIYAGVIRRSLKNFLTQFGVIAIAVGALVASALLVPAIGGEFAPQEDDGRLLVDITLPPGTNLLVTDEAARKLEQIILDEVPETVSILTRVGSGGGDVIFSGGAGGSNAASLTVRLTDKNDRQRGLNEIVNALRQEVAVIPDATVSVSAVSGIAGPGAALQIQVFGDDPNQLIDLANQVEEIVRATPNTVDVVNNDAVRSPETRIVLNRGRLADLGLSSAQVATTLRTAVTGSDVGDFAPEGQEKIEINLRANEEARQELSKMLQLPVGFSGGQPVRLEQVATLERSAAPAVVNRADRQRILTISSSVIGTDLTGVTEAIEARVNNEVVFPPNYGFRFAGATEVQNESFAQLGSALFLSIILIYMLLIALFQNFLQPLAIMISLPLALIGVLLGLFVTRNTLNIFSLLGIIMLAGVVTRNAILIIDFANILQREQGMERKPALVEAGRLRLRPIAMTSMTLIFALMPVLLSTASGSESRQPMAAVLMGGSVTSGFLSLLVVPVMYNAFENLSDFLKWLAGLLSGRPKPDTEPQTAPAQSPVPEGATGD